MRPKQPPRLVLRRGRGKHKRWIIKHLEREISTGAGESECAKAEAALAEYIIKSRQPAFGEGNPAQVLIGDCLAVYCDRHGPQTARPGGVALEVESLAEFFGDKLVSEVCEELCTAYVKWRCAQRDRRAKHNTGRTIKISTARRELVTLSAALNWCFHNKRLDRPVFVKMPKVAETA